MLIVVYVSDLLEFSLLAGGVFFRTYIEKNPLKKTMLLDQNKIIELQRKSIDKLGFE